MPNKEKIIQRIFKIASRTWELKSGEQLDPVIKLLMEAFGEMIWENRNHIESIRENLLQQIAKTLTPDHLAMAEPAHTIARVMPVEPVMEINKHTIFYFDNSQSYQQHQGLKSINFAPVIDNVRLVRGKVCCLLCERNLYTIGLDGEKDLFVRANTFTQDLNRCAWIGLNIDKRVETLKDIHFYFDFPNTLNRYELYDLLNHTNWSIEGKEMAMEVGIKEQYHPTNTRPEGIFSHYNTLNSNDKEIMDLYRKQFLYINTNIRTASLKLSPFPEELLPYFPEKVKNLEPQYWLKIEFPTYFKTDEINDLTVHLNAFPLSNKDLKTQMLDNSKSLTGIVTLPVNTGEYFFAIDQVEDSHGKQYNFIPYASPGKELGGTYTIKRGGLEKFSSRDLTDMIEQIISLFHTELATFKALKIDNIRNSLSEMEQKITSVKYKMQNNNSGLLEVPTYLLIDSEEKDPYIYVNYWTTNCESANGLPYGTILNPNGFIPLEKNSCVLLKTTKGGKAIPKNEDMLSAYKLALTAHGQLFSAMDYENFCRMKFSGKLQGVKIRRGITCSNKQKEGLIRTIDVCLQPMPEYKDMMSDPVTQGELKLELEKRSPYLYNFRILIMN